MDLFLLSYGYDIIQGISAILIIVLCVGILFVSLASIFADTFIDDYGLSFEEKELLRKEKTKKIIKLGFLLIVISLTISTFIPSERTFYIYAGEKLAKQKNMNGILNKIYKLIEKKLEEE